MLNILSIFRDQPLKASGSLWGWEWGAEEETGSDNLYYDTVFLLQEIFFSPLVSMLLQSASNRDVFWTHEPIVFLLTAA